MILYHELSLFIIGMQKSVMVSEEGRQQIEEAIALSGKTHQAIAAESGLKSRNPITRLLGGKRINQRSLINICTTLGIQEWSSLTK